MYRFGYAAVAVTLAVLFVGMLAAQSEVPQVVNIQGFLVDDLGNPVDGTVSMIFDLYDAEVGGNLIERVANRVADLVLEDERVASVGVRVHKPAAPIPIPFEDVMVEIRRER